LAERASGVNTVGMMGNPNELASTWIISVDAFISLTRFEQTMNMAEFQPLLEWLASFWAAVCHSSQGPGCLVASIPPALIWAH